MPKIIDGDDLNVGTEITINTTARTFTLLAAGNLVYKDGVTLQALYSKFIKLWETAAYNSFPFPMYAIDAKSGQFEFGFDGSRFNDWGPADDATREALRDGGWNEYVAAGTPDIAGTSTTGELKRRYVGIVSLGEFNASGQAYYQLDTTANPTNFVFADEPNQAVQIYGNIDADAGGDIAADDFVGTASGAVTPNATDFVAATQTITFASAHGLAEGEVIKITGSSQADNNKFYVVDTVPLTTTITTKETMVDASTQTATATGVGFDRSEFFRAYIRSQGFTFDDSVLADTGQIETGAYTVNVLLSNAADTNIVNTDAEITGAEAATYANIDVSYYTASQSIDINDVADNFDFRIIVDGDNKTLQQIYTKIQYLLRQTSDINTAGDAGTKRGDIQDSLMRFEGDKLICSNSVFIQNLRPQDQNNVDFFDQGGTKRIYDFAATLQLNFNSFLQSGGTGYFVAYITDSTTGADDYGTATAIVLQDNSPADVSGTISAASATFSIDFDNNVQGGRVDADENSADIGITVIAGNKGVAKPVVATGVIERSKSNVVTLTAEQDRAYTP